MNHLSELNHVVNVIFVDQKNEMVEETALNTAQLTALLNAKQVWIEKFNANLKIDHTVWSYAKEKVSLQIYLK